MQPWYKNLTLKQLEEEISVFSRVIKENENESAYDDIRDLSQMTRIQAECEKIACEISKHSIKSYVDAFVSQVGPIESLAQERDELLDFIFIEFVHEYKGFGLDMSCSIVDEYTEMNKFMDGYIQSFVALKLGIGVNNGKIPVKELA